MPVVIVTSLSVLVTALFYLTAGWRGLLVEIALYMVLALGLLARNTK